MTKVQGLLRIMQMHDTKSEKGDNQTVPADNQRSRVALTSIITCAIVAAIPISAWPQQYDEIVVTTRRRAESVQDVPIAVTPITAEQIQRKGVKDVRDIVRLTPSVVFDEAFSHQDTRIAVRGLSNTRGRSNVAFLVDGIDVTSEAIGTGGSSLLVNQRLLGDIERVEVVAGPQSALYGRAAFAGAINYITKDASDRFEGNTGMEVADDGTYELRGSLSGPVRGDSLRMRLNGVYWSEDGHYQNIVSAADVGGGDGYGLALTTNWDPTDSFGVKLRLSWTDDDYDVRPVAIVDPDTTLPVPQSAIDGGVTERTEVTVVSSFGDASDKFVAASEDPRTDNEYLGTNLEIFRAALVASWEFASGTITSYTGYTDSDGVQFFDNDRQASGRSDEFLAHWEINDRDKTEQFSQEFRFATDFDGPVQFTLGGLYWDEDREQDSAGAIIVCISSFNPAVTCPDGWQGILQEVDPQYGDNGSTTAETTHWSAYALAEWRFADVWTLSAEARYIDEEFELDRVVNTPCFVLPGLTSLECGEIQTAAGTKDSDFVTPKIVLEWAPTDDAMIYFSVAKGQKPAGISVLPTGSPFVPLTVEELSFDSEIMWAYELGTKTSWRNDRLGSLVMNAAVFFQDYTDKQTTSTTVRDDFLIPLVTNASSAEVWGLELNTTWVTPVDGLALNVAYTYLDTEYSDFISTSSSASTIAVAGECTVVTIPGVPEPTCQIDLSGNELEKAPEHAFVVSASYVRSFFNTGTNWFVEADGQYQSDRFLSSSNFISLESLWRVNLRTGLTKDSFDVTIFIDNLTDEDTLLTGSAGPDFGQQAAENGFAGFGVSQTFGVLPDPRVFGARIDYRF
jgi:outer membrane receptor protein involved in Fe transport